MRLKFFPTFFVISSFLLLLYEFSHAQLRFTGAASTYNAWQTPAPNSPISARNQLRLNLNKSTDHFSSYASAELRHTYLSGTDSLSFRLREAYVSLFFNQSDLTIGKQIVVWGITDGDFILDLIGPFDLSEFVTQDFSDLREGVSGVSYVHYFGRNQFQVIINPVFESSRLPGSASRWSVINADIFPVPSEIIPYRNSQPRLKDTQLAARFAVRPSLNIDLDVAALYWASRNPSYFKSFNLIQLPGFSIPESVSFRETYQPSLILGGWGTYRLHSNFRLVFEGAWFQNKTYDFLPAEISRTDLQTLNELFERGITIEDLPVVTDIAQRLNTAIEEEGHTGFLKQAPSAKFMAGFSTSLSGWSTGIQYVGDVLLRDDATILQDSWFHGVSTTVSRSFFRDTLLFRLLARYQFNGSDFWINPEFRYDIADGISLSTGAHLFGGKDPDFDYAQLSFSRFKRNSSGFVSVSWAW